MGQGTIRVKAGSISGRAMEIAMEYGNANMRYELGLLALE